jgi:hypothetical protein
MTRRRHNSPFIVIAALVLGGVGCEKEFDLGTLPRPDEGVRDTAYVELSPPFTGFTGPEDLCVGNDQLLYVADTKANRVVMMNRAGQIMSARSILHPLSVAQDSRLDLLVGGEIVASNGDTVGALFRIHLVPAAHHMEDAAVDTLWSEYARRERRFPGVAVFGDNQYLAVRTGPDNSSFVDPDARVMLFDKNDHFITPVPGLVSGQGGGIWYINKPTSVASIPGGREFIVAQSSEGVSYGVLWMRYEKNADFDGWLPKFDPAKPEENTDFIRTHYVLPQAVALDKIRRDVFVADADLDSVFKFTSRGRFRQESFGRVRTGGAMQRPTGLAFFEKVLYVLDGAQGNVLRFRLTTDVPR